MFVAGAKWFRATWLVDAKQCNETPQSDEGNGIPECHVGTVAWNGIAGEERAERRQAAAARKPEPANGCCEIAVWCDGRDPHQETEGEERVPEAPNHVTEKNDGVVMVCETECEKRNLEHKPDKQAGPHNFFGTEGA